VLNKQFVTCSTALCTTTTNTNPHQRLVTSISRCSSETQGCQTEQFLASAVCPQYLADCGI